MGCNTSHEKSGAAGEEENAENEANNEINNEKVENLPTKESCDDAKVESAGKKGDSAEIKEKITNGPSSESNEKENNPITESVMVNGEAEPHENGIAAQEDEGRICLNFLLTYELFYIVSHFIRFIQNNNVYGLKHL